MSDRLMATFRPQAWINDYAVDIDGSVRFDATEPFLSLPLARIRAFQQNNYDSDYLSDALPQRNEHSGPFEVDVEIDEWLESLGYPPRAELTESHLVSLREWFKVTA